MDKHKTQNKWLIIILIFLLIVSFGLNIFIIKNGVEAVSGYMVPIIMSLLFLPIAVIEIIILQIIEKKRFLILKYIFYVQLFGFPVAIIACFLYIALVGPM